MSWLSIGRENGGKAKHVTHSGPIWGGVGEGRRAAKRARTPCRKTCAHPVLACAHLVFLFSGHETMLSSTQKSFGSHLGPIRVPFGSHLGPISVPFGSHLGPKVCGVYFHLGPIWARVNGSSPGVRATCESRTSIAGVEFFEERRRDRRRLRTESCPV